ncbi:hypothetical protein F5Y18DRAFT_434981 [Xylariaceae sp. FL1019]|nr:hypothetical protein F5Y18DRAFT_434981 [Xylariaceae sp. FL1019]
MAVVGSWNLVPEQKSDESFVEIRPADAKERMRREAAEAEAQRIRRAFDRSRAFEYESMIAHGVTGVSCKIRTKSQRGKSSRFVVKRAFRGGEQLIRAENRILIRLRGAAHILQLFRVDARLNFPLSQGDANTIITEYVENGTLYDFFVVKFCIAMAYPPEAKPASVAVSEEIPTDPGKRQRKYQLKHNDMHMNNILIGDLAIGKGYGVEHGLVPTLKLIDFDHAHIVADPQNHDLGVRENIFDIGENMRALIALDGRLQPARDVQIDRPPRRYHIRTRAADLQPATYPGTDPDILYLIMWCMAEDPLDRPTLEALDGEVRRLTQERTAHYYMRIGVPHAEDEADGEIMALMEEFIFLPEF